MADDDQVEVELEIDEDALGELAAPSFVPIPPGPIVGERIAGTPGVVMGLTLPQRVAMRRERTREILGGAIVAGYLAISLSLVIAAAARDQLQAVGVPVLSAATGIVAAVAGFYFGQHHGRG